MLNVGILPVGDDSEKKFGLILSAPWISLYIFMNIFH